MMKYPEGVYPGTKPEGCNGLNIEVAAGPGVIHKSHLPGCPVHGSQERNPTIKTCTCIQDESRDWINCPEHGEKVRAERAHNKKISDQIAQIYRDNEKFASEHNWPLIGGAITTYITMWQCSECYLPTLRPIGHYEWHQQLKADLANLRYELKNGHPPLAKKLK